MTKWTPRGEMRHHLTLQSIDVTPTDGGETTDTAVAIGKAWAKIEPLRGREVWLARAQQDSTTHRINMPYMPDVTPRMRAVLGSRIFNFVSVIDIEEMHRELEIMAIEVHE